MKMSDEEILETFPKRYVTTLGLIFDKTPIVITDDNIAYWQEYFKKIPLKWASGEKILEHPNFTSNILLRKQPDETCKYITLEQLYKDPDIYDIYHKAINYIIIDY